MTSFLTRRQLLATTICTGATLSAPAVLACGSVNTSSSDRYVIRKRNDFENFDPANFSWEDEVITRNVLAPLTRFKKRESENNDWETTNHLATRISGDDDDTVIVFDLREQNWSNGNELTAADVKYSFERIAGINGHDLSAKHAEKWGRLSSVSAQDDAGEITMTGSTSSIWTSILPTGVGCIVSKGAVEAMSEKKFRLLNESDVMSGRYRITQLSKGSHLDLDCTDDWNGDDVHIAKARFQIIREDASADAALEAGEIDAYEVAPDVLHRNADRVQGMANQLRGVSFRLTPRSTVLYISMNGASGPLARPEMRRAVQHALDREEMIGAAYGGIGARAATGLIPGHSYAARRENLIGFDPFRAQELLREAGSFGEVLRIGVADELTERVAAIAQAQLAKLEIRTSVVRRDRPVFWSSFDDFDMVVTRVSMFPYDPSAVNQRFLSNDGRSGRFAMGFQSEEFDSLFGMGLATSGRDERRKIYTRMQDILEEAGATYCIADERTGWLTRDVEPSFDPYGRVADLGDWRRL